MSRITHPPINAPGLVREASASARRGATGIDDLTRSLIETAAGLGEAGLDRAEAKILATTVAELARSFRVFADYRDFRKVSLFGSARLAVDTPLYAVARDFSRRMSELGYMTITGGGDGVMRAGNEGAGRDKSFGVCIQLPFESGVNGVLSDDPKAIYFKYFFTRKLAFVKEADALAYFPGGFGTLDECFETLTLMQTGKSVLLPMVLIDAPGGGYWTAWLRFIEAELLSRGFINREDLSLFKIATDVEDAVAVISTFYRAYHSMRYVRELTVLRLTSWPSTQTLALLNERYSDLLKGGSITARGALREESNEPLLAHLPRLVLNFDRRRFGALRRLIDDLNAAAHSDGGSEPPAAPRAGLPDDLG